jgi:hypothetical protein
MNSVSSFIAVIPHLSMDRINAIIAIGAIILAIFALHVVLTVIKERKK